MDIPSIHQKLAILDVDGLDDLQSSLKEIDGALFNDLDGSFKKYLSIDNTQSSECNLNCGDNSNDRNNQEELELPKNNSSKKCLGRSATFPFPAATSPPNDSSDNDEKPQSTMGDMASKESTHQAFTRSVSCPVSSLLINTRNGKNCRCA